MKDMINLGKRNKSIGISTPDNIKNSINYPSLYISDIDMGLEETDVGEVMEATVKVKVRRVSTSAEVQGTSQTVDLDIMGIKFND